MKGGNAMNEQEIYEKLEEARRIEAEGMALITESLERMETDWEGADQMFEEGTALWKKGHEMWAETMRQLVQREQKPCTCGRCGEPKPIQLPENLSEITAFLQRKKKDGSGATDEEA